MSAPAKHSAEEEKIDNTNDHVRREVLNAGSVKRKHNRILVTGGCGFIGSHLIDRLIKDENNIVICADNCFSGSKSNIAHHLDNPRFEFMRQDVTEHFLVEVDEIYHLACPASPVFYQNKSDTLQKQQYSDRTCHVHSSQLAQSSLTRSSCAFCPCFQWYPHYQDQRSGHTEYARHG